MISRIPLVITLHGNCWIKFDGDEGVDEKIEVLGSVWIDCWAPNFGNDCDNLNPILVNLMDRNKIKKKEI